MNNLIKDLEMKVQRLETESNFKSGIISLLSHDSIEIFSSLLWLTEALDEKTISQEDFFKLLPQIKLDAKKNLQTIKDSTKWLKTQLGKYDFKMVEINVEDLFQGLKNKYADLLKKKNINFEVKGNRNQAIKTDQMVLEYILDKILNNAIKYSLHGQNIFLEYSTDENNNIFSITDFGKGISENNLNSILTFDNIVFEGTDGERGAGLSLKIVDNFVSLMNGSLKIISSENKGATVSVFLPQI